MRWLNLFAVFLIVGIKVTRSCAGMFEEERVRPKGVEEGHWKGRGTIHFKIKTKFLIFTHIEA